MIEGDERAPHTPTPAAHVIAIATTDDVHHFLSTGFLVHTNPIVPIRVVVSVLSPIGYSYRQYSTTGTLYTNTTLVFKSVNFGFLSKLMLWKLQKSREIVFEHTTVSPSINHLGWGRWGGCVCGSYEWYGDERRGTPFPSFRRLCKRFCWHLVAETNY